MRISRRAGLAGFGAALLGGPSVVRASGPTVTNVADTLAGDTRFSRFLDMVTRATMVTDLRQQGPITVFAPVNQAFQGAPAGFLNELLGMSGGQGPDQLEPQRQRLMALINYHIVQGAFAQGQLTNGQRLHTRNGKDLEVSGVMPNMAVRNPAPAQQTAGFGAAGAHVSAGPAQILGAPVMASNGVIYPVSQLLWP